MKNATRARFLRSTKSPPSLIRPTFPRRQEEREHSLDVRTHRSLNSQVQDPQRKGQAQVRTSRRRLRRGTPGFVLQGGNLEQESRCVARELLALAGRSLTDASFRAQIIRCPPTKVSTPPSSRLLMKPERTPSRLSSLSARFGFAEVRRSVL